MGGDTAAGRAAADGADEADAVAMAGYADALGDAAEATLAGWVVRSVEGRLTDWAGAVDADTRLAAVAAGRRAVAEVVPRLRQLLATDVEAQRSTPLSVLRTAVAHPTEVLAAAGVPPVVRDEVAERGFPDDVYDLAPASFADIDEALAEPGLLWGAAKAHVILGRRARRRRDRPADQAPGPQGASPS